MPATTEGEYQQFTKAVGSLLPISLADYKQQQMERRIRDMARKCLAPDLPAFAGMLRSDPKLLLQFEQHITINVSEFYRNPEAFDYLANQILARFNPKRDLKIWSAGCSCGAESYTLAMLLHQYAPGLRHGIYATDIDRTMLNRARQGKGYAAEEIRDLPLRLRTLYMTREDSTYAVTSEVQRLVRFDRHDLLRDQMTQVFDLVVCRNVVIYFTDDAKSRLYQKFVDALKPGGYFYIGATETINKAHELGLRYVHPCFYTKIAT